MANKIVIKMVSKLIRMIRRMKIKMANKRKLKDWIEMDDEEKSKWNGYYGFVNNVRYVENTLFRLKETKRRKYK